MKSGEAEIKNNQAECMRCGKPWAWNDKNIFDFDIPVGKRIWPAVCPDCRAELERKYRSKEINHGQLLMEFGTISGRISKKCAIHGSGALEKLMNYAPKRRGKG